MTNVPQKLIERRAELHRQVKEHQRIVDEYDRTVVKLQAQLAEVSFAIASIEEAAESPKFEAGEGNSASAATSDAPGVESAPAGEYEGGYRRYATVSELPSPAKKSRAPKRDIRGMVLEEVRCSAPNGEMPIVIATNLGLRPDAVEKAVAYWQAKERVTLVGGVVLLRTKQPDTDMGIPISPDPGELPPDVEAELIAALDEAEAQQSEAAE